MSAATEIKSQVQKFFDVSKKIRDQYPEASKQLEELQSAFVTATVRMSIQMLDSMDFHHMAERISEGYLDPQYIPVIRNAAVVLECTPWPENLRLLATSLKSDLAKLAMSLVSKQEEDAKALSHEIHEKEHALSHEASHGSSAAHDHQH